MMSCKTLCLMHLDGANAGGCSHSSSRLHIILPMQLAQQFNSSSHVAVMIFILVTFDRTLLFTSYVEWLWP